MGFSSTSTSVLVTELTPSQPVELAWLEPSHKELVVLPAMCGWKVHEKAGVSELPVLLLASTGVVQALPVQSEKDSRPPVVCMPSITLLVVGSLFRRSAPTTPPALGPVCTADQMPVPPRVR